MPNNLPLLLPPLLLLFLCTCDRAPQAETTEASAPPRPNILFILTDDQGIGDLSLHGNDSIRTPNLDALLESSARLERFYVAPVCAPTRAGFLSGMYAPRTGAVFVTRRRETMDDAIVTLPEHLQRLGYRTGLFGKWHNGATAPYDPGSQGFDEFLGFTLGHFNDYFTGTLRDERLEDVPFTGDLTDLLTDSALHFMLEAADEPFFSMIAYQAPHTPVQVADDHWEAVTDRGLTPYNTGIYAMTESIDEQVGRLLTRLEREGVLDNTLVVYSTDNGPNGDRYRMGLRGTKGYVDEGGVRVPFGIRFPDGHPANGREYAAHASHVDLLPTLLDYLGEQVPDSLDGYSLIPLLDGERFTHYDYDRPVYAFKQGYDFKPWPGSLRNRTFVYVRRGEKEHELYRLDDVGQQHNLWDSPEEKYHTAGRELAARYERFATQVARPELVAPPIDLDAARGPVRLLAHEGEPVGTTTFNDQYGWANDWYVDLGPDGAYWPVETDTSAVYTATVRYHLDAPTGRTLTLAAGSGYRKILLPPALTRKLEVADRTPRKEVYPRKWAEQTVEGLRIGPEDERLTVSAPYGTGLWVKEVTLRRQ